MRETKEMKAAIKEMRVQSDIQILQAAERIKTDRTRMTEVQKQAKKQQQELETIAVKPARPGSKPGPKVVSAPSTKTAKAPAKAAPKRGK